MYLILSAMALEQLQSIGKSDISDEDIIACYECAGDIGLWLMTDQTSSQRTVTTSQMPKLGRTLEIAIQRAPVLLIKNGWVIPRLTQMHFLLHMQTVVHVKFVHTMFVLQAPNSPVMLFNLVKKGEALIFILEMKFNLCLYTVTGKLLMASTDSGTCWEWWRQELLLAWER